MYIHHLVSRRRCHVFRKIFSCILFILRKTELFQNFRCCQLGGAVVTSLQLLSADSSVLYVSFGLRAYAHILCACSLYYTK
jgi:hypothetical protein